MRLRGKGEAGIVVGGVIVEKRKRKFEAKFKPVLKLTTLLYTNKKHFICNAKVRKIDVWWN